MWVWVPIKKYVRDDVDSVSEHGGHHSADTSSAQMKLKTSFPFDHTPFHTRYLMSDLWNDEHHCFLRGLCFDFEFFCLLHSYSTQSNVLLFQACVYLFVLLRVARLFFVVRLTASFFLCLFYCCFAAERVRLKGGGWHLMLCVFSFLFQQPQLTLKNLLGVWVQEFRERERERERDFQKFQKKWKFHTIK